MVLYGPILEQLHDTIQNLGSRQSKSHLYIHLHPVWRPDITPGFAFTRIYNPGPTSNQCLESSFSTFVVVTVYASNPPTPSFGNDGLHPIVSKSTLICYFLSLFYPFKSRCFALLLRVLCCCEFSSIYFALN